MLNMQIATLRILLHYGIQCEQIFSRFYLMLHIATFIEHIEFLVYFVSLINLFNLVYLIDLFYLFFYNLFEFE